MNERQWEEQLKRFLSRTGEEIKRASEEIKSEAEKLIVEVRDPEKHRKVKEGLKELGVWAKKTAEEVGELVEKGVRRAEGALGRTPPARTAPWPTRAPDRSGSTTPPSGPKKRKTASKSAPRAKKPLGKPRS